VVDGDTVEVTPAADGLTEVRLIGVDTPETSHPTYGEQPYGQQAKAFIVTRLEGERVALEFDVEQVDPCRRPLAYVWVAESRMFNEALVDEGYAQMATFPPNVKYVERFKGAQREAREANRGLWELSEGQLCRQMDRGNGIGGGCEAGSETAEEPPSLWGSSAARRGGDLYCSDLLTQEEA
jgi:micrococcal nuclease